MKLFKSRTYKPTGWRIIVKPESVIKKVGNIELAVDEKAERRAITIGTVVEIGPSAWKAYKGYDVTGDWCKVGDRVLFAKYAGASLDDGSEDGLVLVNDEDIEAVITEEVSL